MCHWSLVTATGVRREPGWLTLEVCDQSEVEPSRNTGVYIDSTSVIQRSNSDQSDVNSERVSP